MIKSRLFYRLFMALIIVPSFSHAKKVKRKYILKNPTHAAFQGTTVFNSYWLEVPDTLHTLIRRAHDNHINTIKERNTTFSQKSSFQKKFNERMQKGLLYSIPSGLGLITGISLVVCSCDIFARKFENLRSGFIATGALLGGGWLCKFSIPFVVEGAKQLNRGIAYETALANKFLKWKCLDSAITEGDRALQKSELRKNAKTFHTPVHPEEKEE